MKSWFIKFGIISVMIALLAGFWLTQADKAQTAQEKPERVPILVYHNIGPKEARWTRSVANFKKDLKWLYENGYVLMSIEDFADNNFNLPEGKKPVILTFDDGKQSQFSYRKDGTIDPNCAIGLMDEFYNQHPDFGRAAAFFVNANPFGQKEWITQKLDYLYKTDRQIGYHTLHHTSLGPLSAASVKKILEDQEKSLKALLPEAMRLDTLAYPHGITPKQGMQAVKEKLKLGLLVGAEPAWRLDLPKADPYKVPRIQTIDSEWLRHFKRKPGL